MRTTIMTQMQARARQFERQSDPESDLDDDDFFLDYKLLGVASFVKHVAFEHDDLELLALASKVEMQVERVLALQNEAEHERMFAQDQSYAQHERIREACIRYFYNEPAFSVDMSKYRSMIEVAGTFSDPQKLNGLMNYIDADRVLSKIYDRVKSRLRRSTLDTGASPSFEDVSRAYNLELAEIYRLADLHVSRVLQQYAVATS
ncbi:hypothetical protein JET76_28165 [Pseudomonas putida]|uniref:hypothetical protein n=1 Tax=Pseudomonas putida TaxID=303 RepID=UPI0018E6A12D|nr:hypothetical protein [Pseudomonas putida]MBI6945187.1 hypothetical protein [Pseudomonas putida]MBI6961397.1 hypothetical protein [Pseudomonas putida]